MKNEELLLTPEERLDAEDRALEHLHSQGKIVGKDGFTRKDIAFMVRLFIAAAQLDKARPMIEKQEREKIIDHLKKRFTSYNSNSFTGDSRVTFRLPEDWIQAPLSQ